MVTIFNFKSQVCTSVDQSRRLLELGLKKETADMCYKVTTHDFKGNEINEKDRHYTLCCWYNESSLVSGLERKKTIPAWSLHRLMNLCFNSGATHVELFEDDDAYEILIYKIEMRIKEGCFKKEYLEEKNNG